MAYSSDAPFGSWPNDIPIAKLRRKRTKRISASPNNYLVVYDGKYVAKVWWRGNVRRELEVMLLAGDCSVPVLGRVMDGVDLVGIVMPYEKTLEPSKKAIADERLHTINQLCELVQKLHAKNIIHGDIKPSNVLICSDGHLRFCDFGCASVEGDGFAPDEYTTEYASPLRVRESNSPLTRAEDLYSTGVTIWEIYLGVPPFQDVNTDKVSVEDLVRVGARPDVNRIDDPSIAHLITSYLDSGPPLPDVMFRTASICVATEFDFKFCYEAPPHTYTRVLQCYACFSGSVEDPCPNEFVAPPVTDTSTSPVCMECNPQVYYRGL